MEPIERAASLPVIARVTGFMALCTERVTPTNPQASTAMTGSGFETLM